jgi:hypothetical protein
MHTSFIKQEILSKKKTNSSDTQLGIDGHVHMAMIDRQPS